MKPREKSLWKWLSGGKPVGCAMRRIEDSTQSDLPDVLAEYKGKAFMVELKVSSAVNKKTGLVKIDLSPGQAIFAKNWNCIGFRIWTLVQVPNVGRYLILGNHAKELLGSITVERLAELSECNNGDAIPVQFIERMAR